MKVLFPAVLLLFSIGCSDSVDTAPAASGSTETLPPDLGTRKQGSDWPAFLGPSSDGISTEKGIITSWQDGKPSILWHKTLGIGYGMPTISRGRMFVFDRVGNRARLRACKSETGEDLWSFDYPTNYTDYYNYNNGPRCSPIVDGNRVYCYGAEGMLHCVRAEDGKLLWKVDTKSEFGVIQNFFGVGSTPVIEGDNLLIMIGGSPSGSNRLPIDELTGNGTGLVAFNKFNGKIAWKTSNELASYASPLIKTLGDRRWCFLFARGGLVGIDPASGKIDFEFPWRAKILESVNASNPVVVGNRVLITECYGPGAALLEIKSGKATEIWTDEARARDKSLQCHWNTPIHVDGYVYGSSGRHPSNAELRCVELATGKVMWRKPRLTRSSLLLVDNHFVCLCEDGKLLLLKLNPREYEEIGRIEELKEVGNDGKPRAGAEPLLEEPCWAAPILSHGLLYVRGKDQLVCLELIPVAK